MQQYHLLLAVFRKVPPEYGELFLPVPFLLEVDGPFLLKLDEDLSSEELDQLEGQLLFILALLQFTNYFLELSELNFVVLNLQGKFLRLGKGRCQQLI